MHNPSEIDQNQLLLVRFPKLGSDDVIVPGMANLSFNIKLSLTADLNPISTGLFCLVVALGGGGVFSTPLP